MSRSSSSSSITLVPVPVTPLGFNEYIYDPLPASSIDVESDFEVPVQHMCALLAATTVVKPIQEALTRALESLDRPLRIVGLLATTDSGCHMYARMTARACIPLGIVFDRIDLSVKCETRDEAAAYELVNSRIREINNDDSVDGLIVYFPLFTPSLDAQLRASISPRIDVEGVHPASLERSYTRAPDIFNGFASTTANGGLSEASFNVYPCTPLAVVHTLQAPESGVYDLNKALGERLCGKIITVVNRSETVGRPLAIMLANDGARVYSIDAASTLVYTRSECRVVHEVEELDSPIRFKTILTASDVVISAVPVDSFKIPTSYLRHGAICLDLSEKGNFELDVVERARVWAARLGSVTILMLQINALVLRYRAQ